VSFRYASRDEEDLKIGELCGDCTARSGMNDDKPEGWLADVNTQILKLFYHDKFIGRFNLVLVEKKIRFCK